MLPLTSVSPSTSILMSQPHEKLAIGLDHVEAFSPKYQRVIDCSSSRLCLFQGSSSLWLRLPNHPYGKSMATGKGISPLSFIFQVQLVHVLICLNYSQPFILSPSLTENRWWKSPCARRPRCENQASPMIQAIGFSMYLRTCSLSKSIQPSTHFLLVSSLFR